jgi:DNA-binding response OmpR family regulator
MRIAVLDDDRSQTDLVSQVLNAAGHVCHAFQSGKEMVNQLRRESFDMLIIDWQVPDLSGADVLRWSREKLPPTLPVLFMTSRSGEDDIVAGLAAGADDYMIKPIRRGELVARVQALLRRAYPSQNRNSTWPYFFSATWDGRCRGPISSKRCGRGTWKFRRARWTRMSPE